MGDKKWEELNRDCLVEVFSRLGIEALLLGIPLVCKSWYDATLDPKCWKTLNFHALKSSELFVSCCIASKEDLDFVAAFIKFVVNRSQRSATSLVIADYFNEQALEYVSQECPELKWLYLPGELMEVREKHISKLIGRWVNLEMLYIEGCSSLVNVLTPISTSCHKFFALYCNAVRIRDEAAFVMAKLASRIKYLRIIVSEVSFDNLWMLLKNFEHLKRLDLNYFDGLESYCLLESPPPHIRSLFMKDPMLQDCCFEDLFPSEDEDYLYLLTETFL